MTFLANITQELEHLAGENFRQKRYLLAVSGGLDSMVLLHIFKHLSLNFEVAHCNYNLREKSSGLDADLVKQTCEKIGIKFHLKAFSHSNFTDKNVQEHTRKLRYEWFDELMPNFDFLVTAHHLNDSIETFFINLTRGSGMRGLVGIPRHNNYIIRPLLNTNKAELKAFAKEHHILWREDESNQADKYLRNVYRNKVIPAIEEKKPDFEKIMHQNLERLKKSKQLLDYFIDDIQKNVVSKVGKQTKIAFKKLKSYPAKEVVLYELLHQFGFNYEQAQNMLEVAESGKIFLTEKFKAVVDRNEIIIVQRENKTFSPITFHTLDDLMTDDFFLETGLSQHLPENLSDKRYIYLDVDKINFPLRLRKWKEGNSFQPFGMKGRKKISRFLIDEKIPLPDKENVLVLEDDSQEIIWVVGLRSSEKIKVTGETKKILKLVTKV